MERAFSNRAEAGRFLAEKLENYADRDDIIVLGLPRGGVPVAYEVAQRLRAPLDVFIVRKLGVPGFEELAAGAIASGGVRVLNDDVVRALPHADEIIESVTARETAELERREQSYRNGRPPPELRDRIVILVDDGLATGATMRAAVAALRRRAANWRSLSMKSSARLRLSFFRRSGSTMKIFRRRATKKCATCSSAPPSEVESAGQ
jgi:predicted phosphoribosyltransferase